MFLERLLKLIAEKGISKNKLLTDLGINHNAIDAWQNRGTIPSGETLLKLSRYFGVSVDYLLGENNDMGYISTNAISNEKVSFALFDVFDQKYALTRYAYYLWEALNDLTASFEFYCDLKDVPSARGKADFMIAFKHLVVALNEAAKVLFLKEDTMKKFENVKNKLIIDDETKNFYDSTRTFWNSKSEYFTDIRNFTVHFDHERTKVLNSFIEKENSYPLSMYGGFYCDYNAPIYLSIMEEMYNTIFSCSNADIKTVSKDFFDLFIPVNKLLSKMFDAFITRYTTTTELFDKKILAIREDKRKEIESDIILEQNKNQKERNNADLPEQDKKVLDMLHNLDKTGKEKAEQYLELLSLQYGKTTIEDEIDELISALPDKKDNTVTMRIAAFGGGVREVKVSKDDLRDVVNMLEEEEEN